MDTSPRLVCPRCGQTNYRKLSSIISEGTTTTEVPVERKFDLLGEKNSFVYETTRDVKSVSNLALRLGFPSSIKRPPPPPIDPSPQILRDTTAYGRYDIVGAAVILFTIFCFILLLISLSSNDSGSISCLLLPTLIGIAGSIYFFRRLQKMQSSADNLPPDLQRKFQEKLADAQAKYVREMQEYKSLSQAYQHAIDTYSGLYYCFVCDGVFDPGDGYKQVVPPEQMERLFLNSNRPNAMHYAEFEQQHPKQSAIVASDIRPSNIVPAEIQGLCWGGFLLNIFWGIGNQVWIALLTLIPGVGWVVPFILLFKGNEWAWQARTWDSVEHFKKTQRNWTIAALSIYGLFLLLYFIIIILSSTR